jgi:hypothetical protein
VDITKLIAAFRNMRTRLQIHLLSRILLGCGGIANSDVLVSDVKG